ncbi:DUF2207 domain-containing protein [Agromyces sp. Marseille-P2726]|uniref:DUF2207 domain-containing protein n=1 Tax=Agromyces sp. Marseille-P2726 TaxID=2709132 RepID=UPI00156D8A15|nr:DUF2207 domain-containing protein [Agromyces sp. Marseille-P2726]
MARPSVRALLALPFLLAALAAAPGAAAAAASAPAAEPPLAASVTALPTDVDDFTFASFDAVFELSRDDGRHSVLETTETLVAVFPEFDQNRGIRRAIPLHYDGHPTNIEVESVTDAAGQPRGYEVERDEDGEFLLVTVRADDYVHGEQTYVITYRQHNVTHRPDDAAIDEFYWDVNGTGWAQPFGRVTAELRMSDEVAAGFTGDVACYRGSAGPTTPCDSLTVAESSPPVMTAEAADLGPFQNLTIAAGFRLGTFEPRDESFWASGWAIAGGVGAVVSVLALAAAIVLRLTRWRDHPGRGTIIAQYQPRPDVSAMVAADLVGQSGKGVTATILERAVARELRIVETGRKKYAVEFVGGEAGDGDARSVVQALFGRVPRPGAVRDLKSTDTSLGKRLLAIRQGVRKRVVESGLRRRPDLGIRSLLAIVSTLGAVASTWFGIVALDDHMGGGIPAILFILAIAAAIATFIAVVDVRPLTELGRELRDHLEGLRLYIRLAEADRLRVLQSPSGAMRVDRPAAASIGAPGLVDPPLDSAVVLKLNERLLPYAVLFGLEKEWSRELAALYEQRGEQPGWYAGRDGFNPGAFAVAVSSFSSAASTSWSGSSSSLPSQVSSSASCSSRRSTRRSSSTPGSSSSSESSSGRLSSSTAGSCSSNSVSCATVKSSSSGDTPKPARSSMSAA